MINLAYLANLANWANSANSVTWVNDDESKEGCYVVRVAGDVCPAVGAGVAVLEDASCDRYTAFPLFRRFTVAWFACNEADTSANKPPDGSCMRTLPWCNRLVVDVLMIFQRAACILILTWHLLVSCCFILTSRFVAIVAIVATVVFAKLLVCLCDLFFPTVACIPMPRSCTQLPLTTRKQEFPLLCTGLRWTDNKRVNTMQST